MNCPAVMSHPTTGHGVVAVYCRGGVVGYVCGTAAHSVRLRTLPEGLFLAAYPDENARRPADAARILQGCAVDISAAAKIWLRRLTLEE